jgi:hypothetical protein
MDDSQFTVSMENVFFETNLKFITFSFNEWIVEYGFEDVLVFLQILTLVKPSLTPSVILRHAVSAKVLKTKEESASTTRVV